MKKILSGVGHDCSRDLQPQRKAFIATIHKLLATQCITQDPIYISLNLGFTPMQQIHSTVTKAYGQYYTKSEFSIRFPGFLLRTGFRTGIS